MRSMSSSMTTTDQIEKEIWLKRMEAKENLNKVMQTFNAIMDKLDLMQKRIVPNVEHSPQNSSADVENSEDNMKEDCFVKQEDENPMAKKETMLVKEPHKEFNMTAITVATTNIVIENERNHENTNASKQQTVSSPELKEKCEKTNTYEAVDTVLEAVEAFHDEADMVVKKEAFDDGEKLHRTIIVGNLPLNLKRNREESPEE